MCDAHAVTEGRERGSEAVAWVAARFPRLSRAVVEPVVALVPRVKTDQLGTHAGAITYGALLSIPPILLLFLAIVGFVLADHEAAMQQLIEDITNLLPGLGDLIGTTTTATVDGRLTITLIALPTLLWAATGVVARTRHALGVVFRTELTGLIVERGPSLLAGTALGVGFAVLATATGAVTGLSETGAIGVTVEIAALALSAALGVAYFALAYRLLTPGKGPDLRDHVPGALLFTAAWILLQRVGGVYVTHVVAANTALYGAIGALFGALAFIYATVWAFLLAAELNQVLLARRAAAS